MGRCSISSQNAIPIRFGYGVAAVLSPFGSSVRRSVPVRLARLGAAMESRVIRSWSAWASGRRNAPLVVPSPTRPMLNEVFLRARASSSSRSLPRWASTPSGSTTSTRWLAKYLVWANPSRWVRATRCCSAAGFSVHAMWSPRRSNAAVITTACSAVIAPAAHAVRVHPHRGRSPSASGAVAVAYRIAAAASAGVALVRTCSHCDNDATPSWVGRSRRRTSATTRPVSSSRPARTPPSTRTRSETWSSDNCHVPASTPSARPSPILVTAATIAGTPTPVGRTEPSTTAMTRHYDLSPAPPNPHIRTCARTNRFVAVWTTTGSCRRRVVDVGRSERGGTSWWLRDRSTGAIVIAQPPNAAIVVFLAALALRLSPYDRVDTELRYVGSGALIVWGLDEAVRGVNPFRRALGGLVLLWQAAGLALR